MTIHKEGTATILISAAVLAVLYAMVFYFFRNAVPWLPAAFAIVALVVWLFVVSFFRMPDRELTRDDLLVVSPCDGKVVVIEETTDPEYFQDKRLQVSIFMSPANVHVNLNPVSGEVIYNRYHKGKYLVAWHPKSSTDNERQTVVIKSGKGEILVKQIAGALAKRIVNYDAVGKHVTQGEQMGFIKFGSRVDLLLPIGTKVNVSLNEAVRAGVSVVATL